MSFFENVSIRHQLYLMSVLLLCSTVTVGFLGLYHLAETNGRFESVYRDRVVPLKQLKVVADMYAVNIVDTSHKLRNGNISWAQGRRNVDDALKEVGEHWHSYMTTFMDDEEKRLAAEAQALIDHADRTTVARLREIMVGENPEAIAAFTANELYPSIDPISEKISALVELQLNRAESAYQQSQHDYATTRSLTLALLIFALLLGGAVSMTIMNSINRPLREAIQAAQRIASGNLNYRVATAGKNEIGQLLHAIAEMQEELREMISKIQDSVALVSSSSEQLAAASGQVTSSSLRQGEATSVVAAAMEQLTVSIEQVAVSAGDADCKATDSGTLSEQGAQQVRDAAQEMARIADSVKQAVEQMTALGEQAKQIDSIVVAIRGVAEQTNLLALNAAIEAARAGEQGRGFAVVADEVRNLAGRTSTSALEITAMISNMQSLTSQAVSSMNKSNEQAAQGVVLAQRAGDSMRDISTSSIGVMHAVSDITMALREQKIAGSEIARNVENIAKMTEDNGHAVKEVAGAAQGLRDLARDLKHAVQRFRLA